MKISRNVGHLDRAVRVTAGLVLLPLGLGMLAAHCVCGWVDTVLGLACLVSGLSGFCVFYLPFGVSTVRRKSSSAG